MSVFTFKSTLFYLNSTFKTTGVVPSVEAEKCEERIESILRLSAVLLFGGNNRNACSPLVFRLGAVS